MRAWPLCALVLIGCGDGDTASSSGSGAGAGGASTATGPGGGGGAGATGSGGDAGAGGGLGGAGGGGGSSSSAKPLGAAIEQADCNLPANAPAGAACKALSIQGCAAVDDLDVELLIYPPIAAERGTVVLGTGGQGMGFYNDNMVLALRQLGFRTVNRAWSSPWETGPGGMANAACRYATMVTWVSEQVWQQGSPLCATGNSGGSAEISYALSHYGREDVLAHVVPSGGPPMGRLDRGCLGAMGWDAECQVLSQGANCNGNVQCTYNTNNRALIDLAYSGTPCGDADPSMVQTFLDDSIAAPQADYEYESGVHFMFGLDDCTIALPLGMAFATRITSDAIIEWAQAPHAVFSTQDGQDKIVAALDAGCAP